MDVKKCKGPCGQTLPIKAFPMDRDIPRPRCKACFGASRSVKRVDQHLVDSIDETIVNFGTPIQRACAEALLATGSLEAAAESVQLTPAVLRAHLTELERVAAKRGYAPGGDMIKPSPVGFSVKGVSTLYNAKGHVSQQWVKTRRDDEERLQALLSAVGALSSDWQSKADPIDLLPSAVERDNDILNVFPMGDPHLGMMSWAPETGHNFDLKIAEYNLFEAVSRLINLAPPARRALVVNLGDFFHADSKANTTTAGTPVDVDGRWAKIINVGIRVMRRIIDRCLETHDEVHVICEIGNHDSHMSIVLGVCLAQFYEREPRVTIDTSPAKFHWYRFGANLIGVTHGDTVKARDLPGVMACDRATDWGETLYRMWLCGHVHHDSVKEYPGVTVETFRTLAPGDAWHNASGYRSGRDMKLIVLHRVWGEIQRHTVGINRICSPNEG